jgi:hypothetical protein
LALIVTIAFDENSREVLVGEIDSMTMSAPIPE